MDEHHLVVTLKVDGTVEYGGDYGPTEAARLLWHMWGQKSVFEFAVAGQGPNVRISCDGKNIGYLNGYRPSAEAQELWVQVAAQAPFSETRLGEAAEAKAFPLPDAFIQAFDASGEAKE